MKIKSQSNYVFVRRRPGVKYHIAKATSYSAALYGGTPGETYKTTEYEVIDSCPTEQGHTFSKCSQGYTSEVDKRLLCGHCLKSGLWEEATPDTRETPELYQCKQANRCDIKLSQYAALAAELSDATSDGDTLTKLVDQLQKEKADLKAEYDELADISHMWRNRAEKYDLELIDLRRENARLMTTQRFNGHTLDNLKSIMQAAPPADTLEWYTLEYRIVQEGEEFWHAGYQKWQLFDIGPTASGLPALIRTPIKPAHKEPELVFCMNDKGEWWDRAYFTNKTKPLENLYQIEYKGKTYDHILAQSPYCKTLWLGHWNDGPKDTT